MPSYAYIARGPGGERTTGEIAGPSKSAVLAELAGRRLTPVSVEAIDPDAGLGVLKRAIRSLRTARIGGGVSSRALAGTYGQLADLLRAGVPLLRSLVLLGNARSNPRLSGAFRAIAEDVSAGNDLAEAMAARPALFAPVHVAMVRAGERGGFLEPVLARLARLVMAQAELRSKVIGNLIYPVVLMVTGTVILGIIFGVFIPMFRPIYERMPDLGLLTQLVLAASTVIRSFGIFILIFGVVAALVGWRALRTPRARAAWGRAQMRLPVIGPLSRAIAAARFCRILGTMLGNGVPMLVAMRIARDASGSPVMAEAIVSATEAVKAGQRLAEPLAESGLFAEDVIEMIRVGEQANSLGEVLITIADTLEARVDRLLSGAVKLIEPLMLILLAIVIGLVALALILPMTRIGQAV
ncbi:MAG: type II secretion system F family protein [Phycisphaerales bacterium]